VKKPKKNHTYFLAKKNKSECGFLFSTKKQTHNETRKQKRKKKNGS
jgi:ribosomal protein L37E